MINLNEEYIIVREGITITDALSKGIKCKVINLNHKSLFLCHEVQIFCQIDKREDKYSIKPIAGDKIAYGEWIDLEEKEIFEYCKKIEDILDNLEV